MSRLARHASANVNTSAAAGDVGVAPGAAAVAGGRRVRSSSAAVRAWAILREIPDGATVAADNRLAPQLTARCTVYLFPTEPSERVRPEWVALTGRTPPSLPGYQLVVDRDGVILLRTGDQR
jgi:hypothetical protein